MAVDVVGVALDFIAAYGLVAIFVLLVLDAAMMMPVFPGEVVLVMAVAAYADDYASLAFLVGLTTLAALLGSLLLYGIMRGGGRKLVERYPRLFMMPRKRREKLERSFARPAGQSLVLFLRLVPLTRVLVNIPAGLAKMKLVRFVLLTTAGLLLYHVAFLWFAFEVRRPGSSLASQRQQLQDAYGSPAMEFVSANAILAGLVLLAIGTVASVRASRSILRDPEESTGSLFGWLATMVFLWGGLALAAAAYLEPEPVVALADLGGVDVDALAAWLGLSVLQVLWAAAALMVLVGVILRGMTTYAHGRRRRHLREQKAQKDPDYRRKALHDPFRERGPDDGMPEDLVAFEDPSPAPPPGRRPG
jgi:membrane protein DedA with SNARE-associated domain